MKRNHLRRWLLPAFLLLGSATRLCLGLPVAATYPPRAPEIALRSASDLERELLAMINVDRALRGMAPLEWDAAMSAVAREHSQDMAEYDHFEYASPRLGTMEYRLHRAGVSAPNARYALFRAGSLQTVMSEIKRGEPAFHMQPATHMGVGIKNKGLLAKDLYVTLLSRQELGTLEPFPIRPAFRSTHRLTGRIRSDLRDPKLLVTLPNGKVIEPPLSVSPNGRFEAEIAFTKGRGEYTIETLAVGELGPVVLNLLHCYAGTAGYPRPPRVRKAARIPSDLRKAERMMFQMINRSRRQAGLAELEYDERLAGVARAHSEDMRRNGFFAHVSPTQGDLTQRMKRAGIKARAFTENLSTNLDLGAAHQGLMDSPGHRKNILDPDATDVGVGIVRRDEDQLIIVVNFSQAFPTYDTEATASDFYEEVNEARARSKRSKLKWNDTLAEIALENSQWMREHERLSHARVRELLQKEKMPYPVRIDVFKSVDPPTPEHIGSTLEKQYRSIGIGIVQDDESASGEKWLWSTVLLGER